MIHVISRDDYATDSPIPHILVKSLRPEQCAHRVFVTVNVGFDRTMYMQQGHEYAIYDMHIVCRYI